MDEIDEKGMPSKEKEAICPFGGEIARENRFFVFVEGLSDDATEKKDESDEERGEIVVSEAMPSDEQSAPIVEPRGEIATRGGAIVGHDVVREGLQEDVGVYEKEGNNEKKMFPVFLAEVIEDAIDDKGKREGIENSEPDVEGKAWNESRYRFEGDG